MKVGLGPLSMELPDGWNDRTVYTFVAPRVVDPRRSPHLRMRSGFRENIAIHYERVSRQTTPESFITQQIDELKPKLQGFRLLYNEEVYISSYQAQHAAYRFSLRGQRMDVCQLRVAILFPQKQEMLVFTGTAAAHVFENKKRIFWQIIHSLELPPVHSEQASF